VFAIVGIVDIVLLLLAFVDIVWLFACAKIQNSFTREEMSAFKANGATSRSSKATSGNPAR